MQQIFSIFNTWSNEDILKHQINSLPSSSWKFPSLDLLKSDFPRLSIPDKIAIIFLKIVFFMRDTKIRCSKFVVLNKGTHWNLFPAPFVLWYWNLFSWVSTRLLGLFSHWCLVQINIRKLGMSSEFRVLNIFFFFIVWCPNQPRNARFCCLELLSLFLCVDKLTLKNTGWKSTDLIWRIRWGFAKTLVWNNLRGQWQCLSITAWTGPWEDEKSGFPSKERGISSLSYP